SPWKWRHLKSVIVPSVQSPPSMLKLHDFCNRALQRASADHRFPDFDENAVATSFYTSGTTGLPKAVSFTHRQIVLHTMAIVGLFSAQAPEGFRHGDVYMPITPMFHVHAWGIPYAATMLGLKQVYPGRYVAAELIALRTRERVTFSHCVPTVLQMLLDANETLAADLSDWTIVVGGSALPLSLRTAARRQGIRAIAGYGMSETGPILALTRSEPDLVTNDEEQDAILCRTGRPIPLVQMRIVDEEMRDVPHDGLAQGEIVVRAPWLTASYAGNVEASADLWRGGWLHTQDVATIDPDGFVQIRDRLKDVIKTGGEWISSLLLEELLLFHPGIKEVAIIAVPDQLWGERPVAVVVTMPDATPPVLDDIRQHLQPSVEAGTISRYAVPDRVIVLEHLPRTSVGKIDKKQLRLIAA
ncbi:AMP-binding protein, partial [Sphingomonas sp. Root710]|uniref:AMP-binding protein n=1 Tax=Sphingomonas sp. Root710 TaxID=1736594 RepID=UPI000A721FF3